MSRRHMTEKKRFQWIIRRIHEAATLLCPGWRDIWLLVVQKPTDWWRDEHPPSREELAAICAGGCIAPSA